MGLTATLLGRIKLAIFSLLPVVTLLAAAETAARIFHWDRPAFTAGGHGAVGVKGSGEVADADLGWSMKPGYRQEAAFSQKEYAYNSLGLRSPEVGPKRDNELRILSLGESTTEGLGVEAEETYSQRLQVILGERLRPRPVTVINAGVRAYSSFQSLKYFELRGLKLKPDIALFYHELNDYLPSTVRDPGLSEVEILQSDRQLYDSGLVRLNWWLRAHSALYRSVSNAFAQRRLRGLTVTSDPANRVERTPYEEIGLPRGYNLSTGVYYHVEGGKKKLVPEIHPALVGRRVTDAERRDNLLRFVALCRRHGIIPVIMHPSYRSSARHECLLTRFCAERRVPMLETYDLLHPPGSDPDRMFRDSIHPSAVGHEALAEGLASFIVGLLRQPLS